MGKFDFFRGNTEKNKAKVDKLIARLGDSNKKDSNKSSHDENYGFHEDEKIIDELERIGDPAAIPALIAKEKWLAGFQNAMVQVYDIAPTVKAIPGKLDKDKRLYQYVSELREKIKRVISVLEQKAGTRSEADKGREVKFVIPCGVCGYKTEVTVIIDWKGSILSGSDTDHEFKCQNCKKVFTVRKDSLKQYTASFV